MPPISGPVLVVFLIGVTSALEPVQDNGRPQRSLGVESDVGGNLVDRKNLWEYPTGKLAPVSFPGTSLSEPTERRTSDQEPTHQYISSRYSVVQPYFDMYKVQKVRRTSLPRTVPIKRGPPSVEEEEFVPLQLYSQVRKYDTVRRVPHAAPEEEPTDPELASNAPRLRQVVTHKKIQQVYEEKGYEDSGYDHGGYKHEVSDAGDQHRPSLQIDRRQHSYSLPEQSRVTSAHFGFNPGPKISFRPRNIHASSQERNDQRYKRYHQLQRNTGLTQQYRGTRERNSRGATYQPAQVVKERLEHPPPPEIRWENPISAKNSTASEHSSMQNGEISRIEKEGERTTERPTVIRRPTSRILPRRRRPNFRRERMNTNLNNDRNPSGNNLFLHAAETNIGISNGTQLEREANSSRISETEMVNKVNGRRRSAISIEPQIRWKKEYSTIKRGNATDKSTATTETVWDLNANQRNTRHPSIPRDTVEPDNSGDKSQTTLRVTRHYLSNLTPPTSSRAKGFDQDDSVAATKYVEQLTLAHLSNVGNNSSLGPMTQSRQLTIADLVSHRNNGERESVQNSTPEHGNTALKRIKRRSDEEGDKYPFYSLPSWRLPGLDSPIRYATNPSWIPNKSGGKMEFYKSRHIKRPCSDPEIPKDVELKVGNDGRPPSKGQRKAGLGQDITCFKIKFFGNDPFDNPFFKEDENSDMNSTNTPDGTFSNYTDRHYMRNDDANKQLAPSYLDEYRSKLKFRKRRDTPVVAKYQKKSLTAKPLGFTDVDDFLILTRHKTTTVGPPISLDEFMKRLNITGASKTRPPLTKLQGFKSRHNPTYSSRYRASDMKNLTEVRLESRTNSTSTHQQESRIKSTDSFPFRRIKTPKPTVEGKITSPVTSTTPPTTTPQSSTSRQYLPKRSLPRGRLRSVDAIAALKRQRSVSSSVPPPYGTVKQRKTYPYKSQRRVEEVKPETDSKTESKPDEAGLPLSGTLHLSSTARSVLGKRALVYTVDPATGEGKWIEMGEQPSKQKSARRKRKKPGEQRNSTESSQYGRSGTGNHQTTLAKTRRKSDTRKRKRTKYNGTSRRQDEVPNSTEGYRLTTSVGQKSTKKRISFSTEKPRPQPIDRTESQKNKTKRYYRKSHRQ